MFVLGEPLDAASVLACGMANAVVPLLELRTKAHAAAVALTKRRFVWCWCLPTRRQSTSRSPSEFT
jgi:hypothetical protein